MEQTLREKVEIFVKSENLENAFIKKMIGIQGLYETKKNWDGCHHLLLVYDASKLSTVYVVKSPVLGLQRAIFQKNQDFFQK